MRATTKLAQALRGKRPALTAECRPPRGSDASAVRKLGAALGSTVDAVVVGDNHAESTGSALACAALLAADKLEPVLPLLTRDRNRVALESDVLGAAALGIQSFLCMSGTHQALGACPQAAGAYDIDSTQLTQALKRMSDEGVGFAGDKLGAAPDLFIGATAHPSVEPVELSLLALRKKLAAGAQAVWTDAIFNVAGFEQWMQAVRAAGLADQVAIIASVLPVTSTEQAEEVRRRGAGEVKVGVGPCGELARKLVAVPGVRGIHFLTGGQEALLPELVKEARLV
jgi:methylenetetrahydrofolate reductase (NADPH)